LGGEVKSDKRKVDVVEGEERVGHDGASAEMMKTDSAQQAAGGRRQQKKSTKKGKTSAASATEAINVRMREKQEGNESMTDVDRSASEQLDTVGTLEAQ
jgi:hypothetical protein